MDNVVTHTHTRTTSLAASERTEQYSFRETRTQYERMQNIYAPVRRRVGHYFIDDNTLTQQHREFIKPGYACVTHVFGNVLTSSSGSHYFTH